MEERKDYPGFDFLKLGMALLVAERHVIQVFFEESNLWRVYIGSWLSNLAVPVFFAMAGFFLFRKFDAAKSDHTAVFRYCGRILRLYVLWSVIYLPVNLIYWYNDAERSVAGGILSYLHHFLFDSTIPQLWYLPALLVACLFVWFAYAHGVKIWQILVAGLLLFAAGTVADNWYFNQRLPMFWQEVLSINSHYFITVRNGVFYGIFFVALGLMFAKTAWRPPWLASLAGAAVCLGAAYWEASRFYETNFVFMMAPSAYFVFMAAEGVRFPGRKRFPRIRAMSEWVYFSHFYFFHFFTWTRIWNPIPVNNKSISAMIIGAVLLFSWGMVRLSEMENWKWLKKLI